jgi:hypothetical protein
MLVGRGGVILRQIACCDNQITDTHLFAEKHETLLGINTWESYQAVLSAIHASAKCW